MSETLSTPEVVESVGAKAESKRKRILLVEGDGFTRLVLLLRLRLAGFAVDFTSNGVLGLGKIRSCNPDILLVELKLCGLSGLQLIKAARAEPTFGDRPIFVYTHTDRISRSARKELGVLASKVFNKNSITREDLVQTFAKMFLPRESVPQQTPSNAKPEEQPEVPIEVVPPAVIKEIVAGVREQSEALARNKGERNASGSELLSRVRSLASCAKAAGLSNLARQAKTLENLLNQLKKHGYTDAALGTVTRAVEVMSRMSFEAKTKERSLPPFSAVLVDEAPASNRAIKEALLNAGFEPACFEEPARAREHLAAHRTDLIVANVVLPEAHSLALTDIRKLPLHAQTHVIFGPESTNAGREELPTSAPRLDKEPLLLAELTVRALNEVQSPAEPARSTPASTNNQRAAATLSVDDGFDLFAKPTLKQNGTPLDSHSEPAEEIAQPSRWSPHN